MRLTLLFWRGEELYICSQTGKEILQKEQSILQNNNNSKKQQHHYTLNPHLLLVHKTNGWFICAVVTSNRFQKLIMMNVSGWKKVTVLMNLHLVNVETKWHKGNTQTALLWSLTSLWTHVQYPHC